ncbi:MAG: TIGR02253 family HAD-type hydrolase [Chlorobi bacterium]|nr:MAG: TIGR02253 family HAD-type hydrolase [Bacteroidota bacterium]MBL1160555.1 TIGR02253 family HAD-type hydrolase [Chlorobiota bacterium]MBV6463109.1 Phosphoglycolate phosphatase [Chlorobiota bacterium]
MIPPFTVPKRRSAHRTIVPSSYLYTMIRAVVFDLDNTLVDFMAMKRQAVDAAIGAMMDAGLQLTFDQVKEHIDSIYAELGIEYQKVFDMLLENVLGYVDPRIISAGIIAYRRAREAALKPYPHVTATLMQLNRKGLRLGILSDAPTREAWLRLCFINYHHFFDEVVTFDDTGKRKPDPAPFRLILNRLNVQPHEAIMVGDWAERDMVGAKNVGMKTAFAKYGDSFGNQITEGVDYVLDEIKQLLTIVEV